ncbi:MAG TPA: sialate O-acetylesterase, partial [Polyangiaceae bacterium]
TLPSSCGYEKGAIKMSDLRLSALFSDHLVLQRERDNPIWGWDRPGQRLTLRVLGVAGSELRQAVAAADGSFTLSCPALPAGGPYEIEIMGSQTVTVRDVFSGEVWLASGQSNMEWPVGATRDAEQAIERANLPALRQIKIPRRASRIPERDADARWEVCTPRTVAEFSAVAHFFATELHQRLNLPIGIIDATWGGTSVDAWVSTDALSEVDASVPTRLAELDAQARDLPRIREAYLERLSAWERASFPADPPNLGFARGYANLDFNDRDWRVLELPALWQRHGMQFNGVVWFRRELELPSGSEHDLWLELGAIDDFDHTYFNGTLIGSHPDKTPNAFQLKRRYRVPRALIRPGKNVIAVRVFDHFGEGGFVGPRQAMFIEAAQGASERISLAGPWRICVEHEIPLVSGEIFASWPQAPLALAPESAPGTLFNGMLSPLFPYGIRGAIWYQGESDADRHATYAAHFRAFIRDLRRHFAQDPLWFLFVQLAGFRASGTWPMLREAQASALSEPCAGMVTAIDIGEARDIHPRNKREVGSRLARLARAKVYGEPTLEAEGPTFEHMQVEAARVTLHFSHAKGLRSRTPGAPRGFEVAAADGIFHEASARIHGDEVSLECAAVPEPVAVRYAWHDDPDATLENEAALPALPFRAQLAVTRA